MIRSGRLPRVQTGEMDPDSGALDLSDALGGLHLMFDTSTCWPCVLILSLMPVHTECDGLYFTAPTYRARYTITETQYMDVQYKAAQTI